MTVIVPAAEERRRTFHTLDMLRGIAAAAVVGRHLNDWKMPGQLFQLMPGSHLAVDLFFVLSGFVIAHAYDPKMRSGLGVLSFMKMRVVRLWPLYILGTAIGILLALKSMHSSHQHVENIRLIGSIALALFFLPAPRSLSFNDYHVYAFNIPAWSLFWELVVNLFYASIARFLNGRLLALLIALGAASLITCTCYYGSLDGGQSYKNFASGGLRVGYSFFAGIAVYRLWASGRFSGIRIPPLIAATILVAIMVARPASGGQIYDVTVALLVFPVLVFAATQEPGPRLRPFCTALGLASYPLYALHAPFVTLFWKVEQKLHLAPAPQLALECLFVAVMIGLALMADRLYDRPVRAALGYPTKSDPIKIPGWIMSIFNAFNAFLAFLMGGEPGVRCVICDAKPEPGERLCNSCAIEQMGAP